MELDTLNSLLDWIQNAGQPGGAPLGTQIKTVSQVINGPDTQAPVTALQCDGAPCQSTAYNGSTTISLPATDPGSSGVAATYYTTDGSTPTTTSAVYTAPFTISASTTVQFFSVDNAGNVETVHTQLVQVQANADPVIGAAGDIACDPTAVGFNFGQGTATDCRAADTVKLLTGVDAVLPLGDEQYNCGGLAAFEQSYGPTWGTKKAISYPVPGDREYTTSVDAQYTGGTDCPSPGNGGAGYQQYFSSSGGVFGSAVPSPVNVNASTGYYSYNLGSWHVIALNTSPCALSNPGFYAAGSAQDVWLKNDLATHQSQCTLAYFQNPRWASTASGSGGHTTYQQFWQDLYNGGADVVLNGDSHWYERFAPLNAWALSTTPTGSGNSSWVPVGPGSTPGPEVATSQVLDSSTHGVLKMTLHNGSYGWTFVNDGQSAFTDSGTSSCHSPDTTPPTTTISPSSGWSNTSTQVTLTATDAGSGVAATYYTTNGTTPTTSSTRYTVPFTLTSTSTVKFFSVDNSGNTETVKSQVVQIDAVAPTTTIKCNGATCTTGWYKAPVQVTLTATDNVGGSGWGPPTTPPTGAIPSRVRRPPCTRGRSRSQA